MLRVLVVDDSVAFRRSVHQILGQREEFDLVGEASDGLEAVDKADKLQPDLIVLDIGLPKLNGIEAARQIVKLAPKSKVIFVSVESSPDVVHAALSLGHAYVLKAQARTELLIAVEAVLNGKQYVSNGLTART